MSSYQVNKICRLVLHDKSFRASILAEPEAAIGNFELTDEERAALLKGDVLRLYKSGASSFLLLILPRYGIFGLDFDVYNERMLSTDS
jgi:hypothetical protein